MRLYKALYLWRPERKPNLMHAPKLNSKSIGPERDIGHGRIQNHKEPIVKKRSAIARFFKTISKQFAYSRNQTPATVSGRKPNPIPGQPAPRAYEPKTATQAKHSVGQKSNLRPIERQREIGNGAVKKRTPVARFFKAISKQFAYSGNQTTATAASRPKPNPVPAQVAPRAYDPKAAMHVKQSVEQKSNLRPIGRQREIGSGAAAASGSRLNPIPVRPTSRVEPNTDMHVQRSAGPKLDSRPIGPENGTDRVQSHRQTVVKKRGKIATFFKAIRKQVAFSGIQNPFALSPIPRAYEPNTATHVERSVGPKVQAAGKAGSRVTLFVSVCFGLLVLCGVIIALLFVQIKDMKFEMARRNQHLSALEAQFRKVEKNAQESRILEAAPRRVPITLSNDDIKAIRGFIKVLPSQPGTQPKFHVGDEISNFRSTPVPEPLVNQLPKLRGTRFLVDENGAIIIIGDGSSRADVVIEPQ